MNDLLAQEASIGALPERVALRTLDCEDRQVFPIASDKTTIGNGQSCTLRLNLPGVKPLHCLITRSEESLTIRRWSDGTLLNGEVFTEAQLALGDRIRIGPLEMELASAEERSAAPATEVGRKQAYSQPKVPVQSAKTAPVVQPGKVAQSDVAAYRAKELTGLIEARTTGRRRARTLLAHLRAAREDKRRHADELDLLNSQLRKANEQLAKGEQQQKEVADRLAATEAELSTATSRLAELHQLREEQEQAYVAQISDLVRQVADRNELIQDLQAEIERRQEEFDQLVAALEPSPAEPLYKPEPDSASAEQDSAQTHEALFHEREASTPGFEPDSAVGSANTSVDPVATSNGGVQSSSDDRRPEPGSLTTGPEPISVPESPAGDGVWDIEVQSTAESQWESAPSSADDIAGEHSGERDGDSNDLSRVPTVPFPKNAPSKNSDLPTDDDEVWEKIHALRASVAHQGSAGHAPGVTDSRSQEEAEICNSASNVASVGTDVAQESPGTAAAVQAPEEVVSGYITNPQNDDLAHRLPDTSSERDGLEQGGTDQVPVANYESDGPSTSPSMIPTSLFDPPEPAVEQPKESSAPVSFLEQYKHLLEDDDEMESGKDVQSSTTEPPASSTAVAQPEQLKGDDTGEDESIEAYMAKMMERLRGESSMVSETSAPATSPATTPTAPLPQKVETVATPPEESEKGSEPEQGCETRNHPRPGPVPEKSADMSALRDLANNSAREAIKIANVKREREKAYANLLMSSVAGALGGYLVWEAQGSWDTPLLGGAAAVAASGYWACRTVRSLLSPHTTKPPVPADGSTSEIGLPISGPDSAPSPPGVH